MVNGNRVVGRAQRRKVPGANPVVDGGFDQACDRSELDLSGNKRRHSHLIGSVEYRVRTTTCPYRLVGQTQARKPLEVRRLEGELSDFCEIEPRRRANDSVRPS